jgi:hypothetical protein
MSNPSIQQLHSDLTADLKKLGSDAVANDEARKTFSTQINGAIFVFGHKQADPAFWSGVKHYGSGPRSRFRMRRTLTIAEATAKPPSRRKPATA